MHWKWRMNSYGENDSTAADRVETALADLGTQVRETPTKRDVEHAKSFTRWFTTLGVIVSTVIAVVSLSWSGLNSSDIADNSAKAAVTDQSIKSLQDANEKLAARGLPQIPVPAPGQQVDINGLVNSVSALVLADITGDPRFKGHEGSTGRPGEDGRIGRTGEPGQPGTDGSRGLNGETPVPSISEAGHLLFETSAGINDVGSVMGPAGPKGDKGDPGDPAPVCPEGFTPQKFWVDTYDDADVIGDATPTRTLTILCV